MLDLLPCLRVTIEHAHDGPFFEKPRRRGRSYAAGPARDQDSLRFQAAHSLLHKTKSGRSGYLSARERAIAVNVDVN